MAAVANVEAEAAVVVAAAVQVAKVVAAVAHQK